MKKFLALILFAACLAPNAYGFFGRGCDDCCERVTYSCDYNDCDSCYSSCPCEVYETQPAMVEETKPVMVEETKVEMAPVQDQAAPQVEAPAQTEPKAEAPMVEESDFEAAVIEEGQAA